MKVTNLIMFPDDKGFRICWTDVTGFGEFDFVKGTDGEWEIENECMGDTTIREALSAIVDFIPGRRC